MLKSREQIIAIRENGLSNSKKLIIRGNGFSIQYNDLPLLQGFRKLKRRSTIFMRIELCPKITII